MSFMNRGYQPLGGDGGEMGDKELEEKVLLNHLNRC